MLHLEMAHDRAIGAFAGDRKDRQSGTNLFIMNLLEEYLKVLIHLDALLRERW